MDISNTKRSILVASIIAVLFLIILFFAMFIMVKNNNLDFRSPILILENPTVTYTMGEAEYIKQNSDGWKPIEIGKILKEGDSVRTGFGGIIDIKFTNGTLMRVIENSFLSLDDVNLSTIDINLKKGGIISKFTKLFSNQKYSVKTPSMAAGIRGTELIINTNEKGTEVLGLSGITEIYNPLFPEKPVLLGFQMKTTVLSDQEPSNPLGLTKEEVNTSRNLLDSINADKVIVIGEAIQFKADTAEIIEESQITLEKLAKKMRWRFYKIEIRGHTADVGDSGPQYALSIERAESIKEYLILQKIKGKRMLIKGYGGSKPIASNETPEGKAANRRVEFVIVE